MQKDKMRALLDATNGGLDIFRNYIKTPFTLDKMEVVKSNNNRFIVSNNERYKNYVVRIENWDGMKWTNARNFNAVWFVKELYGLNEQQAYDKIEYDMDLNISIDSNVLEKTGDNASENLSDESNNYVKNNSENPKIKQSLLEELMISKPKTSENIDSSDEKENKNNETIQKPKLQRLPGL